jgi:CDP-glycerol glycerophosphotransferase (TagB/SpsB family)
LVREAGSAFEEFREVIPPFVQRLQNYGVSVIGHGHPKAFNDLKPWWESFGVETEREWQNVVEVADVYMIDNSSTIFEAAALDIPILLMESKRWRRDVSHGMRFWDYADVGPSVVPGDNLERGFAESLDKKWRSVRERVAGDVYDILPGGDRASSRYAADAIVDWLT